MALILFLLFYKNHTTDLTTISISAIFISSAFLQLAASGPIFLPKRTTVLFTSFLIALYISSYFSKIPELSSSETLYYTTLFLLYIVSYNLAREKGNLNKTPFPISIFFWPIVFIISYYFSDYLRYDFASPSMRQFSAPLYWHNQMAAFLTFLIPFSLYHFITAKGFPKILFGLISCLLISAFILTYSRAGWISLGIGILIATFLKRKEIVLTSVHKKLLFTIVVLGVGIFISIPSLRLRALSIFDKQTAVSTPALLRTEAQKVSLRILKDSPLMGVGPGTFGQTYVSYQKTPWLFAYDTHNHYLQVAAESGLIAGALFGLLIIVSIYELAVMSKKKDPVFFYTFIPILAIAIHNLFDVDWNWPILAVLFWLFIGFLRGRYRNDEIEINKRIQALALFFTILLLICSLYFLILGRLRDEATKSYTALAFDLSSDLFLKEITTFPLSYEALLYLARINSLNGNSGKALTYYQITDKANPFVGEGNYVESLSLAQKGDLTAAIVSIDAALLKEPFARPEYYEQKARLHLLSGDIKGAKNILSDVYENKFPVNQVFLDFRYLYTATGFDKRLAQIYFFYADLLYKEGEKQKAQEVINSALTHLDKNNSHLIDLDAALKKDVQKN